MVDLLWPQPPLTCSSHQGSTPGPLRLVVAACVKDARPSRWLAPLERPRWPPPPSGWTRHQPRCFRHERVGWRGSAGDVWLLLGARTWRTGRCAHLSVRSCAHLFGHTSQTPPSPRRRGSTSSRPFLTQLGGATVFRQPRIRMSLIRRWKERNQGFRSPY